METIMEILRPVAIISLTICLIVMTHMLLGLAKDWFFPNYGLPKFNNPPAPPKPKDDSVIDIHVRVKTYGIRTGICTLVDGYETTIIVDEVGVYQEKIKSDGKAYKSNDTIVNDFVNKVVFNKN